MFRWQDEDSWEAISESNPITSGDIECEVKDGRGGLEVIVEYKEDSANPVGTNVGNCYTPAGAYRTGISSKLALKYIRRRRVNE